MLLGMKGHPPHKVAENLAELCFVGQKGELLSHKPICFLKENLKQSQKCNFVSPGSL